MIQKTKHLAILFLAVFIFSGYMLYRPAALQWNGKMPSVSLLLQLPQALFSDEEALQFEGIAKKQAVKYFQTSGAAISITVRDVLRSEGYPTGITGDYCSANAIRNATVNVINKSVRDRDCTASACVFMWSCEGKNKFSRGTIQFNFADYAWNLSGTGPADLSKELLHSLGHTVGLNHCRAGEIRTGCSSDPKSGTMMHRFIDDRSNSIHTDDSAGLRYLYGENLLPFPETGVYAISTAEAMAIESMISYMSFTGMNSTANRGAFNTFSKGLLAFTVDESGKSITQQTNEFFSKARAQLPGMSNEDLEFGTRMNAIAIFLLDGWLREAKETGAGPASIAVMTLSKQKHEELREAAIDLLETRK